MATRLGRRPGAPQQRGEHHHPRLTVLAVERSVGYVAAAMGSLDGRVAIITGGGRGLGRTYGLLFAGRVPGRRQRHRGRQRRQRDRRGRGEPGRGGRRRDPQPPAGEAVANARRRRRLGGRPPLVETAIEAFGGVDILVNNAGILRDRLVVNMTEAEWDDVIRVHLRGHFCPTRHVAAYWRDEHKAGRPAPRHVVNTSSTSGSDGEPRAEQLRRRQVGDRHVHPDRRQGTGPLRRQGQLHRPGGADPDDAGDARPRRHHGRPPTAVFDEWDPANVVAARRLSVVDGVPVQRGDVLRAGRDGAAGALVGDRRERAQRRAWESPSSPPALEDLDSPRSRSRTRVDRPVDYGRLRSGGDRADLSESGLRRRGRRGQLGSATSFIMSP